MCHSLQSQILMISLENKRVSLLVEQNKIMSKMSFLMMKPNILMKLSFEKNHYERMGVDMLAKMALFKNYQKATTYYTWVER